MMAILVEIGGCFLPATCQGPEGDDYYRVVMRIPTKSKERTSRDQSHESGIPEGAFILVNNSSIPIQVGRFLLSSGMSVNLTDRPDSRKIVGSNDFNKFLTKKGLFVKRYEKTNILVVEE